MVWCTIFYLKFLISGGASSLLPYRAYNITLEDKIKTTEILLKAGATIQELNTVRKHISAIKGGLLAKYVYPATMVNLIISDVIGKFLLDTIDNSYKILI